MFKSVELTGVIREHGDHDFISLLNKILIGYIYETAKEQLEQRFIQKLHGNYPVNIRCICLMKTNLLYFTGKIYLMV